MAHGVHNFCFVQFDKTVYNNDLIIDVKTFWRQFLLLIEYMQTAVHYNPSTLYTGT